jgi:oligopeptide/dipeptide ABC transporter ATP-binding protein
VALTFLIVGLAFVGFAFEELADPQLVSHGWHRAIRRRLDPVPAQPCPEGVAMHISDLVVTYGSAVAVDHADLQVRRNRMLGLVGESGGGKSTMALAIMGLLPQSGHVSEGSIVVGETDLRRLGRVGLQRIRGRQISVVPQAAMSLLDPTMNIAAQVIESAQLTDKPNAPSRARDALSRVGIPPDRHRAFPHQLSGGQRQRVVIAMAVVNRPRMLIADEPTTGLDVVTQRSILDLIDELRVELQLDVVLISHDLPLLAARADDLAIMYAGRIVETGPASEIVERPEHPYTRLLLGAFPALDGPSDALRPVPGDPPDLLDRPDGCSFAPRCPERTRRCTNEVPAEREVSGHRVACHHAPFTAVPVGDPSVEVAP